MAQDDDASGIVGVGNRDEREEVRVESTSASGDDVSPSPREEEGEAIQVTTVDRLHADGSKHHANVKVTPSTLSLACIFSFLCFHIDFSERPLTLQGRFVTVFRLEGKFYCIDSVCYHAGGPLVRKPIHSLTHPCMHSTWLCQ